jgi:RHS repeat-associated protein
MTMGSDKYYLHYDQVGSLRAISDNSHHIIKEITYDSFGNILSETNKNFKIPFGFAGGLYDTDTKLTRFGYRDYDAYVGKWTAKDPIGFGGGDSNLYGYVLGDGVNFVDPSGLKLELCKTNDWLFHTFWKVDEQSIGFYPKGGSAWYTDGQYYSNDPHHDKKDFTCKEFPNNSQCVETCIINYAVYHKAPKYSLALHQCRDEALDMLKTCLIKCSSKKR